MRPNLFGIILILASLSGEAMGILDYFQKERCAAGEVMEFNSVLDRRARVFHEMTFDCEGKIGFWECNVKRDRGKFYASVWRRDKVSGEIIMVGKNMITPSGTGYQIHQIKRDDQIHVLAGDFIGIHYPKSNTQKGILTVELQQEDGDSTSLVLGTSLSNFSTFNLGDSDLRRGVRLQPNIDKAGKPSLRARVLNVNRNLRLAGGPKVYEGRAEIFTEGTWGTICDKWFENRGWPLLFCLELGFPNVTSVVSWSKDVGSQYQASKDVPIHLESPRCKTSDNISMFDCQIHPKGFCGHDLDVVIKCEPRVRLANPTSYGVGHRHEGVPLFYDYGEWRVITDDTPVSWHKANRDKSWVTAICRELNYVGFRDVLPLAGFQMKSYDIGYCYPECRDLNPNLFSQCPPSLIDKKCPTTSYMIICEVSYINDPHIY